MTTPDDLKLLDLLDAIESGDGRPVPECGRWMREGRALGLIDGDPPELTTAGAFKLAHAREVYGYGG